MSSIGHIGETVVRGALGIIIVSAVLSWSAEHNPGGPFSAPLEILGSIAAWVIDPSTILIILVVGFLWKILFGDEF